MQVEVGINMSKEALDKALGIKSFDDYMSELNIEEDSISEKFKSVDETIKADVDKIDEQIEEYNKNGIVNLNISNIESSLGEIKDLITDTKGILKHLYESIVTNELIDPEIVMSFGNLLEAAHLSIKEYIDLYKDRLNFYDKVRLETIKFEQKKELMELKYKLDAQKNANTNVVDAGEKMVYNTMDVVSSV